MLAIEVRSFRRLGSWDQFGGVVRVQHMLPVEAWRLDSHVINSCFCLWDEYDCVSYQLYLVRVSLGKVKAHLHVPSPSPSNLHRQTDPVCPLNIGTMIKFDGDSDGPRHGDGTCK